MLSHFHLNLTNSINCFIPSYKDTKRLIGRKFDDYIVMEDMKHLPFNVKADGARPKIEVEYKGETKAFWAEEISSMVLSKMKTTAEAYLGKVNSLDFIHTCAWFPTEDVSIPD